MAEQSAVAVRLVIRGRVTGVNFRAAMRREAHALGVSGWARNADGTTVEALLEGPADGVAALTRWARSGPPHAEVESVAEHPAEPAGRTGFERR
jgi:acylphosphatase